jgi:hypothetical protein
MQKIRLKRKREEKKYKKEGSIMLPKVLKPKMGKR